MIRAGFQGCGTSNMDVCVGAHVPLQMGGGKGTQVARGQSASNKTYTTRGVESHMEQKIFI